MAKHSHDEWAGPLGALVLVSLLITGGSFILACFAASKLLLFTWRLLTRSSLGTWHGKVWWTATILSVSGSLVAVTLAQTGNTPAATVLLVAAGSLETLIAAGILILCPDVRGAGTPSLLSPWQSSKRS